MLLLPQPVAALTQEELLKSIEVKNKELETINQKIQETQKSLETTTVRGKTLQQEISRIDRSIGQVNLNIRSSELTIDKLSLEIVSLDDKIEQREAELEKKRSSISETLRQVQLLDNENMLMRFLKSGSLAEGLAKTQAVSDLNDGLLIAISDIERIKTELNQQLEVASGKKNSKEQEAQTLKVKKDIIEDQRSERQTVLAQTNNQERTYQKMLAEFERQQQEISSQIEEIEATLRGEYDQSLITAARAGALARPVSGAPVTQGYGATAFAQRAYKSKFHNGIDYGARIGTPLMAAEDGEVIAASMATSRLQYGYYILIKHDNGLTTLYAHMSRFSVAKGAQVKRGQVIGYSGNTGYTTGPHLHFTVYQSATVQLKTFTGAGLVPVGVTVNPANYL